MAETPFVFGRIADPANFTDREAERARLLTNFEAGINTTIISPRRWGKSSLVDAAAAEAAKTLPKVRVCLIDLFSVRDETEFYAQLAKGVLKATTSRWEEFVESLKQFLGHLRPKVSFSPDFTQEVSFDLDWDEVRQQPDEILDLAENLAKAKGLRLVVCIDEFQSIAGFADPIGFQRELRAHWQRHQHVSYCLYGSKRHMLTEIFTNPAMPFYKFGDILPLERIDNAAWVAFIVRRFAETGKEISDADAAHLASVVDNHSYYVQQLAQLVWFRANPRADAAMVDAALDTLKDQLSLLFVTLTDSLTTKQLRLLQAIADGEPELSSQATLGRYRLGTSANVARMKETLTNRELIDVSGKHVEILDPVFRHWLLTDYFGRSAG